MQPPPLAHYKSRAEYTPAYGDFVIWSGWFTSWYGFVTNYNKETQQVSILFSGLPYLLLTMDPKDHEKETRTISLLELRQAANGKYTIKNQAGQHTVWYI